MQNITMQLISEERKTRASLSKNINVQDKVGRSAGVLKMHGCFPAMNI